MYTSEFANRTFAILNGAWPGDIDSSKTLTSSTEYTSFSASFVLPKRAPTNVVHTDPMNSVTGHPTAFDCDPSFYDGMDTEMRLQPLRLMSLDATSSLLAIAEDSAEVLRRARINIIVSETQSELFFLRCLLACIRRTLAEYPDTLESDTAVLRVIDDNQTIGAESAHLLQNIPSSSEASIRSRHGEKALLRVVSLGVNGAFDILALGIRSRSVTVDRVPRARVRSFRDALSVYILTGGRVLTKVGDERARQHLARVQKIQCPAARQRARSTATATAASTPYMSVENVGGLRHMAPIGTILNMTMLPRQSSAVPLSGFLCNFDWQRAKNVLARELHHQNVSNALEETQESLFNSAFSKLVRSLQASHYVLSLPAKPLLMQNDKFALCVAPSQGRHLLNPFAHEV